MIREGEYTGQGYAIGVENTAPDAYDAGRAVAESATDGLRVSLGDIPGVMSGAGQAVGAWGEDTSTALGAVASAVPPVVTQLASLEAESKRVSAERDRLSRQLLDTTPYTTEYAAIEEQIKILDAWGQKLQLDTKLLEASRTALDGFTTAQSKALAASSMQARTGAGGLGAGQAATALLTDDTAKAGETLFTEAEKFVTMMRQRGIEGGDALMEAAATAARERSPETVNVVLGMLADINAKLPENARLGADTWATAWNKAAASESALAQYGSSGAAALAAWDKAFTEGGQGNIDAVAGIVAKQQAELAKLPEFVRGIVAPDMQAASALLADAPNSPEARAALARAEETYNHAVSFFPRDLEKQEPEVRAAATRLYAAASAGQITWEEAAARLGAVTELVGSNFDEMDVESRAAVLRWASGVEDGADRSTQAMRAHAKELKQIADDHKATYDRMTKDIADYKSVFDKYGYGASPGMQSAAAATASMGGGRSGGGGSGGGSGGGFQQPMSQSVAGASMSLSDEGFRQPASDPNNRPVGNWDQVINYLTGTTIGGLNANSPGFTTPGPVQLAPETVTAIGQATAAALRQNPPTAVISERSVWDTLNNRIAGGY
jgi:hypothetical protein